MYKVTITFRLFALVVVLVGFFVTGNASGLSPTPDPPILHNLAGENISTVQVGQQAVIRVSVHNDKPIEQPFIILIEVRDSDGITQYLSWQSGIMKPNGDYSMKTLWTPNAECGFPSETCSNYEIRKFVISSFEDPEILYTVTRIDGIMVTSSPPILPSPKQYDLVLNNQTYQIE